jgi:hypothetical protein
MARPLELAAIFPLPLVATRAVALPA